MVVSHITDNKNDGYMGSGIYLQRAQKKYGLDKFEKEILFECSSQEEMYSKETELVDEIFVARFDTYNLSLGGKNGGFYYINKSGLGQKGWNKALKKIKELHENDEFKEFFSNKMSIILKKQYKNGTRKPIDPKSFLNKKTYKGN